METSIVNTKHQPVFVKAISNKPAWSGKLMLYMLIVALVMLAISLKFEISPVLAVYEEMLQQLGVLEQLLDNPNLLIGNS